MHLWSRPSSRPSLVSFRVADRNKVPEGGLYAFFTADLGGSCRLPENDKRPAKSGTALPEAGGVDSGVMRPRGFFGILGWLLVKLRLAVVLFWAVVALAAYLYLPSLGDSTTSSVADVVPESAAAARAQSQDGDL